MSYQVIALKWRPQNFQNMIGQKHISQTLQNALQSGRLPQAILFTGPRGTGKTSTARILAKSLRCQNLKDFVPCGVCSDCEDISAGRSLDVVEIDGASNNGVDSIRELRDSVSFRPSSGDKKVYIIDEVHMLSISAFNALLKTLEEPPEHVVFILATTEVHKIPKTILSRCHRFDFRKISIQDIADYLEKICESEGVAYEKQALWSIARQGQGSVRDSLSFLDQVITYSNKNLTYDNVRESLGLTDRRLLTQILENIIDSDKSAAMQALDSLFAAGTDINIVAEDLLEEIKNLLVVKTAKDAKNFLDLPEAEIEILASLSQKVSEAHIHLLFDMMLKLTQDLYRTQDQKTVLEVGVLKLCLYAQVVDLDKLSQATSAARPMGSSSHVPSAAPVSSSQAASGAENKKVTYQQEAALKLKVETKTISLRAVPEVSKSITTKKQKGPQSQKQEVQPSFENQTRPQASAPQVVIPQASPEQKKWNDFVEKIIRLNVKVGEILKNCHYRLSDSLVEISAPEKIAFIQADIVKEDFQKQVHNYVRTFLGPDYQFKVMSTEEFLSGGQAAFINRDSQNSAFVTGSMNETSESMSSMTTGAGAAAASNIQGFSDASSVSESGRATEASTLAKEKAELKRKQDEAMRQMIEQSEVIQTLKKKFKNVEIISVKEQES